VEYGEVSDVVGVVEIMKPNFTIDISNTWRALRGSSTKKVEACKPLMKTPILIGSSLYSLFIRL